MIEISERDQIFLEYIASGYSTSDISEELQVSRYTIDDCIARLLLKLGAKNRAEAAVRAIELGIVKRVKYQLTK